jgi:hypothetical protein
MKLMKTALLISIIFLCSCASTTRDIISTGHPLGVISAMNDHEVDIRFESERVSGDASGTTILKIFHWGPGNFSDGLAVQSTDEGFLSSAVGALGSMLPDSGLGKVKSAAVRDACDKAKCDVLGYPMFYIDEMDYLLWTETSVSVVGFPGKIHAITNKKHVNAQG